MDIARFDATVAFYYSNSSATDTIELLLKAKLQIFSCRLWTERDVVRY